ncbi:MAG: cyclic nucleotide-binding domain-containing protein [Proteobacteria bacterium]|nr:cyclic nucleotide-binding domain-containing protein [Pseudomonadota bacterium]
MPYEVEFEFHDTGAGEFRPSSNVVSVINSCLKKNDIDQAASLLAASDSGVGELLINEAKNGASREFWKRLAKLFGAARDMAKAAYCAEAVDDHEMAARFHEEAYEWEKAAEIYSKAGILHKAAEMYERGLLFDKAAAIYLKSKDYLRAANCYARSGALYHAGHLYMKVGRYEQAVEVLQSVDRMQKWFVESSTLLGLFFEKTGNPAMAIDRYAEVVQSKPIDSTTLDVHHRLAALLIKEGHVDKAEQLWNNVLHVNPKHDGAVKGLESIPKIRATASPPPPRTAESPATGGAPEPPPLLLPGDDAPRKAAKPASVVILREDFDVFRSLPIFSGLSLDELRLIHTLADRTSFEAGEILIEHGKHGKTLFVITGGQVKVELISEGKSPVQVATLSTGASLGEMAMVDEAPASARVTALERVNTFSFPLDSIRTHLEADPRAGFKVMRVLGRILSIRLREANLTITR